MIKGEWIAFNQFQPNMCPWVSSNLPPFLLKEHEKCHKIKEIAGSSISINMSLSLAQKFFSPKLVLQDLLGLNTMTKIHCISFIFLSGVWSLEMHCWNNCYFQDWLWSLIQMRRASLLSTQTSNLCCMKWYCFIEQLFFSICLLGDLVL